jgi:hypothetical protein
LTRRPRTPPSCTTPRRKIKGPYRGNKQRFHNISVLFSYRRTIQKKKRSNTSPNFSLSPIPNLI